MVAKKKAKKPAKRSRKSKTRKKNSKNVDAGLMIMLKGELAGSILHTNIKHIHKGKQYPIVVEALPCVRAGSGKAHKHFKLKVNYHELRSGDLIEITKDAEKGYLLSIKELPKRKNARR
jgi:hypothetical protein